MENDLFIKSFEVVDTIEKETENFMEIAVNWYLVKSIKVEYVDKDGTVHKFER